MPLYINTNVASLQAQTSMASAQAALVTSFQRLSSGLRINSAADDAAGLSISESLNMQASGYAVAERNANAGISLSQTAEGGLAQVGSLVARMRDLAMESASGELTSTDRTYLNTEFDALKSEITRIANSTRFNNAQLINGGGTNTGFQVGIGTNSSDQIFINLASVDVTIGTLFGSGGAKVNNSTAAQSALTALDIGLSTINSHRETFGAAVNRLQVSIAAVMAMRTNLQAANSRIRDVDVADETAALTRRQVILQAGTSVLAQANQLPQIALTLLR